MVVEKHCFVESRNQAEILTIIMCVCVCLSASFYSPSTAHMEATESLSLLSSTAPKQRRRADSRTCSVLITSAASPLIKHTRWALTRKIACRYTERHSNLNMKHLSKTARARAPNSVPAAARGDYAAPARWITGSSSTKEKPLNANCGWSCMQHYFCSTWTLPSRSSGLLPVSHLAG